MQQAAATGYKFLILTNTLTGTNVKTVINVKGGDGDGSGNHGSLPHSLTHASHSSGTTTVAFHKTVKPHLRIQGTHHHSFTHAHTHLRKTTRDTHNNTLTDQSLITG